MPTNSRPSPEFPLGGDLSSEAGASMSVGASVNQPTAFEIINPSDSYTIVGTRPVACAAVLLLGRGHYGLEAKDGETTLPLFLFGDPRGWFKDKHGSDLLDFCREHGAEIATCLESVLIGGFPARVEYDEATAHMTPEQRAEFTAKRHERRRTSMNNIGLKASSLAKAIREKIRRDEGNK